MKKLALYALTLVAALLATTQIYAQAVTACTGKTAPALTPGFHSEQIGGIIWTPAPNLATQAVGLPNVEYLIVKKGVCARDLSVNPSVCDTTNGGGDVIVGTDKDGIFEPSQMGRYGITLAAGDTFGVVAVGYNLAQIKTLLDQILTGTINATGAPCCSIFNLNPASRGFCDTLRNNGITSSAQINNLTDVLAVFDAFSKRQLSVKGLIANMNQVNGFASSLPSECGGSSSGPIVCYGVDPSAIYWYKASNTTAIESVVGNVNQFAIFPNPVHGDVNFKVETTSNTDLMVNVYNSLGVKVSNLNLGTVNGTFMATIPSSTFAAGMYLVELTDGKNSQTSKLIVR